MYIVNGIVFAWDSHKAEMNLIKHGVSFEEACSVFLDESAILFDDPDHSDAEDRFLLLGTSHHANMLVVCHCYRDQEVIRIISARKATSTEQQQYIEIRRGW